MRGRGNISGIGGMKGRRNDVNIVLICKNLKINRHECRREATSWKRKKINGSG